MVVVLAAAFYTLVAISTMVLPGQDSLAVAATTLAVFALFNPLWRRIQLGVDKRPGRRIGRSAPVCPPVHGAHLLAWGMSDNGSSLTTSAIDLEMTFSNMFDTDPNTAEGVPLLRVRR